MRLVLLGTFMVAMAFAIFSDIRWEDYYITYRTSRNLVEGHGLVFQPGERLHTFTSPLGVLLPAVCLWIGRSDEAALWLFRGLSAGALALAAALLFDASRRSRFGLAASLLVLGGAILDAKTLTFTVSGMETGFMLLFLSWLLRTLIAGPERHWAQLGSAFGGLMWTRPDGCVFIAALSLGYVLFGPPSDNLQPTWSAQLGRRLKPFLPAAALCTAIYLPWFVFAWAYYGTPVPNTVLAKSLTGETKTLLGFITYIASYPIASIRGLTPAGQGWLPHYFGIGGWPLTLAWPARLLELVAIVLWLAPFVRWEARVASFAAAAVHCYLGYFPIFVFPWYLPPAQWLDLFALAAFTQQIVNGAHRAQHAGVPSARLASLFPLVGVGASAVVAGVALLGGLVCFQLRQAQRIVEFGVRKPVGLWLREHARPGDTIALEPLGYIGYYSQLKTFDYLGLSSREVTAIRREFAWKPEIVVEKLKPTWVIGRGHDGVSAEFSRAYEQAAEFDQSEALSRLSFPGRAYLEFDVHFIVYHRRDA